jgi:hypothetical protein
MHGVIVDDDSFKCIRIMLKILLCIVEEAVLWQTSPCTCWSFGCTKKRLVSAIVSTSLISFGRCTRFLPGTDQEWYYRSWCFAMFQALASS